MKEVNSVISLIKTSFFIIMKMVGKYEKVF